MTGMWDPSFTEMMHSFSGLVDIVEVKPTALFADVNGLHDINNEQGHEAGDNIR